MKRNMKQSKTNTKTETNTNTKTETNIKTKTDPENNFPASGLSIE